MLDYLSTPNFIALYTIAVVVVLAMIARRYGK